MIKFSYKNCRHSYINFITVKYESITYTCISFYNRKKTKYILRASKFTYVDIKKIYRLNYYINLSESCNYKICIIKLKKLM